MENLDIVVEIVKHMANAANIPFAGAILRPHAFVMTENEDKALEINEAVKKAGQQLVTDGKITPDLFDIISQPLISEEELRDRYSQMYRQARDSKK